MKNDKKRKVYSGVGAHVFPLNRNIVIILNSGQFICDLRPSHLMTDVMSHLIA